MVVVVIAREFAVTGLRLLAVEKGEVIPAGILGKLKTISQLVAIILILLGNPIFNTIGFKLDYILLWISVIFNDTIWNRVFQKLITRIQIMLVIGSTILAFLFFLEVFFINE